MITIRLDIGIKEFRAFVDLMLTRYEIDFYDLSSRDWIQACRIVIQEHNGKLHATPTGVRISVTFDEEIDAVAFKLKFGL